MGRWSNIFKESYGYNLAVKRCSFDINSDGNIDIFLSDSSGSNSGGWVQRSGANQLTSPADKDFSKPGVRFQLVQIVV